MQEPLAPNLKHTRAFAKAWPEPEIVQQLAAQIPWFHACVLLDTHKPIGVAGWTLIKDLPPKLEESLPTVEMLEEELVEVMADEDGDQDKERDVGPEEP